MTPVLTTKNSSIPNYVTTVTENDIETDTSGVSEYTDVISGYITTSHDDYTALPDGFCTTKGFHRAAVLFTGNSRSCVDPINASIAFSEVATKINQLGKSKNMQHGTAVCNPGSGKVPCDLLDIPTDELPCQMAERLKILYDYVSESCSPKWHRRNEDALRLLFEFSAPKDGSECPSPFVVLKMAGPKICHLGSEVERLGGSPVEFSTQRFFEALREANMRKRGRLVRRYESLLKLRCS